MPQEELASLTIAQAARLIQERQLSPVELTAFTLERIERLNPTLNAYITVTADQAMQAARQAEEEIGAGGYRGPLHGIPISLKDLYASKGVRTTAGSKILGDWVPDFDATAAARLKAAGAIVVGKAHTAEFACGATGLNHHFGPCRNPWNPEHVSGGSSSGSGASVATGMALGSMGSDTGASVRLPASLCGITGLKPSYGLVSRHGIVPLSWSLDHAGPLTRTAEDAALMLQAIAGHDHHDPSSTRLPVPDYSRTLGDGIRGLRIGVPTGFAWEIASQEVAGPVRQALTVLEEMGATLQEVSLPLLKYVGSVGTIIAWTEGASWHEHWVRTRPQDYGPLPLHRFRLGLLLRATHYHRAQRVRALMQREFSQALQQVDAIASPTAPIAAPRVGQESARAGDREASVYRLLVLLTRPYNLTGLPAITVPCGFTERGLPVGLQIAGRLFDDAQVLRIAHAYQQATDWHTRRPPVDGLSTTDVGARPSLSSGG